MLDIALNLLRDAAQQGVQEALGRGYDEELVSLTRLVREGRGIEFQGRIGLTLVQVVPDPDRMRLSGVHVARVAGAQDPVVPAPAAFTLTVLAVASATQTYSDALLAMGHFAAWAAQGGHVDASQEPRLLSERLPVVPLSPSLGDQLGLWTSLGLSPQPSLLLELSGVVFAPQV